MTYCKAPFTHLSIKTDGNIKSCCRALPGSGFSNLRKESILDAWSNPYMKKLREDLLAGIQNPNCDPCWNNERDGVRSLREKYNDLNLGEEKNKPVWLELKMSNLCNLRCRMCHVADSTAWASDFDKIRHLHYNDWLTKVIDALPFQKGYKLDVYNDQFFKDFKVLASDIVRLSFAGGEPMYDEKHYTILEMLQPYAHKIDLSYATNATIDAYKDYNIFDLWKRFKSVQVSCSIDGYPALSEYIRTNSNIFDVERIIKKMLSVPTINVTGKITLSAWNIFYVPETFEYFKSLGLKKYDYHFVTFPEFLDCRIWNGEARNVIDKKLNTECDKTQSIRRYFSNTNKYSDNKFATFVEYTKALDESRGTNYMNFDFLRKWI